jgi:hypothetical protein
MWSSLLITEEEKKDKKSYIPVGREEVINIPAPLQQNI